MLHKLHSLNKLHPVGVTVKKVEDKLLVIKYISFKEIISDYLINVQVISKNLKSLNASLTLYKYNYILPSEEIKIQSESLNNSTKNVSFRVSKKSIVENDEYYLEIKCDGEVDETGKFFLKPIKNLTSKAPKSEKCLCKKSSWTADDLKKIVKQLRKSEDKHFETQYDESGNPYFVDEKGRVVKSNDRGRAPKEGYEKYRIEKTFYDSEANDGKLVEDRLFYLDRNENINEIDKSYERLAEALNYIFKKLDAKKCINKIHILCQIYHETERFGSCYESDVSAGKSGEDFYRGRGLVMITKKSNYKTFYEPEFD